MLRFLTSHFALHASLVCLGANAQSPALDGVRASLQVLADSLTFQGNIHDTYAPVLENAADAFHAMALVTDHSIPGSRAEYVRSSLERLLVECQYWVGQSSDPNYIPGALEADDYLTANVAEWQFAIKSHIAHLQEELCDITYRQPTPAHIEVAYDSPPGTVFADNPKLPEMVIVPPGSYVAGSDPEEHILWNVEENKRHFEYPKRQVTIQKPLAFSKTEITVRHFKRFLDHTCYKPRGGARWWDPEAVDNFVFNGNLTWDAPGFPQTLEHPVVAVTRYDAQAYADWVSIVTGAVYRLPTEDEWEWAARGGATTTFFWGDTLDLASEYANTYDNTSAAMNKFRWPSNNQDDGYAWTAPVASFKPNAFGLFDMTANAREFMVDDWQEDLTTSRNNGSVHIGPAPFVTVRGGAWNYNPKNLRLNYRSGYTSSEVATNMFGIRLVREL